MLLMLALVFLAAFVFLGVAGLWWWQRRQELAQQRSVAKLERQRAPVAPGIVQALASRTMNSQDVQTIRDQAVAEVNRVLPDDVLRSAERPSDPMILVVDDSATAQAAVSRTLQGLPYRLRTAHDGLEAMAMVEQEKPALVLTDVDMPHLDGFGLLQRLKGDVRYHDVPVILMTTHLGLHWPMGVEQGLSGFVTKPYDEQDLREQIAFLLSN